jgi:hypothetical protein
MKDKRNKKNQSVQNLKSKPQQVKQQKDVQLLVILATKRKTN